MRVIATMIAILAGVVLIGSMDDHTARGVLALLAVVQFVIIINLNERPKRRSSY